MTHCPMCRTEYAERSYPRFIRSKRDRAGVEANGLKLDRVEIKGKGHPITWVTRLYCDCGWRFQLRLVDVQLLENLLPDYYAQQEIRRRAA